ncbi:MAG TPA: IPT/TIG domain-containing protein [Bryobacteraceae bacterium]|nr:IPT/TIG domain-containing protein [Bryobacteraceae bacterium]
MRISLLSIMLLLASPAQVPSQSSTGGNSPMMSAVEPDSGRIGDTLTVQGQSLGADAVAALYLTDGQHDTKVVITEQTPISIKFKIPPQAKAGRFALMVLTKGDKPKLIEEPVKVTVEPEPGRPET